LIHFYKRKYMVHERKKFNDQAEICEKKYFRKTAFKD